MALLSIVTAPDIRLTKRSLPVKMVTEQTQRFLDDMLETMYHNDGAGLAAVQVGVLERILVVDIKEHDTKKPTGFYPLFMINPEITEKSEELAVESEGCLSLPEQRFEIVRPASIKVKFLDYHNTSQELEADDWLARVLQHEIDHLDGKLMIDYLSPVKKDVVLRRLKKLKKDIV